MLNDFNAVYLRAKANDQEASAIIIDYFLRNVDNQLSNLRLSNNEYSKKYNECLKAIVSNLNRYYESEKFIEATLKSIKEIIYMNKNAPKFNSSDVVKDSEGYIRARILTDDIEDLDVPVIYKECARLYYINGVTPENLAIMYKCSETIIYNRLRAIANMIFLVSLTNNQKETYGSKRN